jgi:LuxR family maltose regulon positive regulatory protein
MPRALIGAGESIVDPRQIREDKFRVPRLREEILIRSRVRDLISDSVRKRVTVITGPAGAGKTIACASWAAQAGSRRIVWLSLDEGDRDQERFWAHLGIAARAGRDPAPLSPLIPRSRSGADRPAAAMEDILRAFGGPAVLILDDVHELAGSAALHDLNFLLGHAPDPVRIILSGRWLAGSHVARLRLSGDLAEIGGADLACTPGEAAQYLARIGVPGTEADQAGLLAYTRGWMGGLKLVALGGPGDPAVADYLRDEVLDGLSPQDRLILLRTSVAGEVTEDLAEALCDEPGAGASLGRLSGLTGLAEPGENGRYRLSPLLRDTLLAELRRERPREVPGLFGRAARWYAAHGDAVDSVRCAVEAGDWEFASRLLAEGGFFAELPGRAAELERLLGEFPAARRTADPAVAGAFAAARLCADDPETAAVWLTCAAQRPPDARLAPIAWLTALRVMLTGADAESKLIAESSPDGGPPAQQAAIGLLWFALGTAALRDGNLREARDAFSHAEHRFHVGLPELVGRVRGWQALAQARRGDLTAADRLIGELRGGGTDPAVACLTALATAHVAMERDDAMAAAAAVGQADPAAAAWLPGEPDAAAIHDWLRVRLRHPATHMAPDPAHPLTRARALLGGADADGALALAREFLGDDAQASGPRELITARLVAAVASRARGDSVMAARLLEQALAAAAPHGAYLPFLEGGTALRTAISLLIPPTSDVASFAARVLARFQAQLSDAESATDGPAPTLTDSELAVLRLLPAYLTNQEIAEALFLSVNTVKTHLRIAYRKLGVTSRRAAIAQGRRLGVL